MDFLDSLDLEMNDKKSHRVRSWYLYEQFRSLERNQLDATQKLKDKSNQDRILHRELTERRARRRLYDQFGLSTNESQMENSFYSEGIETAVSASSDDFFESFCDLHGNVNLVLKAEHGLIDSEDVFSPDDSQTDKPYEDDFKSIEDLKDENSYSESVNSVVENAILSNENFANDIKEELKMVKRDIADNINLQLETVKENIQCLENFCNEDKISEVESVHSNEQCKLNRIKVPKKENVYDNNIFALWSRLVSFAYQLIQLSHGNCYYNYSSQLLTAVLACDVLRRGISRMCHYLQPYVSPIKYATDESDTSVTNEINIKRRKSLHSKKRIIPSDYKLNPQDKVKNHNGTCRFDRLFQSERLWPHCSKHLDDRNNRKKRRRGSEPCRVTKFTSSQKEPSENSSLTDSMWPEIQKYDCGCHCHAKLSNSMLNLVQQIDDMLKLDLDIDKHM